VLATYDVQWPAWFADRAADLRRVLGARARLIEPIGSASVPDLAATPIIDVVVPVGTSKVTTAVMTPAGAVADPADEAAHLADLEGAGYQVRVREPSTAVCASANPNGPPTCTGIPRRTRRSAPTGCSAANLRRDAARGRDPGHSEVMSQS
jgi:GrpB-like predicted nucleotidyltransferase (UPF0157 family)